MSMAWSSLVCVQNVHEQSGSAWLLELAITSPADRAHLLKVRVLAMRRDTAFLDARTMPETA
ncbi:MAG: hypothetical protein LBJ65_18430 [Burkholderia sp.]|jgi:hypothetical protein|uniref:hypothetical protein n=1 Tax=Burkholderia sp. TaxID=36773 RepID=UPI002820E571|nr:hypothetical protein [Burkholderia sp.]MDR0243576.1 hypothetical protein [Burkholderia sp.]